MIWKFPGNLVLGAALLAPLALLAGHGTVHAQHPTAKLITYVGPGCKGRDTVPRFEKFMGIKPFGIMTGMEYGSWDRLHKSLEYGQGCWQNQPYRAVVSVPMLVQGAKLSDGAAGKFDDHFRQIAETLVRHGRGDSYLRIGWEFNGGWYPWAAARDPVSWRRSFRRIATIFRRTKGAKFIIIWNPGLGRLQIGPERVYPGDDVVDIIGADFYNRKRNAEDNDPRRRWQRFITKPNGLKWLADFAGEHGKPIAIVEWGTGHSPDGMGPGDDPMFVRFVARWIRDHDVVMHGYWDYDAKDYRSALTAGQFPKSGVQFRLLFGAPSVKK